MIDNLDCLLLPEEAVMPTFSEIRVGVPIRHEALGVFPLFAEPRRSVGYLLCREALAGGTLKVTEVDARGAIPYLRVDNRADTQVLFLEGEELRGARQNRVLNTSVLVGARSRTTIPVSCVERGRWTYQSPHLDCGGSHASSRLRHILKKSVHGSVAAGLGHTSNQDEVWIEVGRQARSLGSRSPTEAMSDTYDRYRGRLAEYHERLRYVEGASGLAVAVASKVVSVDLFDKPDTCRKVWDHLLSGLVLDALELTLPRRRARAADEPFDLLEHLVYFYWEAARAAGVADVEGALATLKNASWQPGPAVGAGQEFRAKLEGNRYASALVCDEAVLHASLVMPG